MRKISLKTEPIKQKYHINLTLAHKRNTPNKYHSSKKLMSSKTKHIPYKNTTLCVSNFAFN